MRHFDDHARELDVKGITKLDGFVAAEKVRTAQAQVLELASKHGIYSDCSWTSSPNRFGMPKPFRNALNALNRSEKFPRLIEDRLTDLIESYVGRPVSPLAPGQQILFSLPCYESWSIPSDVWHIDLPKIGEPSSPGLQVFTFLDDVAARGGATLVIAGSHRLHNHSGGLSSKELKGLLSKEAYFRSLFSPKRCSDTNPCDMIGRVGDVELEVIELTGRIGDVYLMDLRVLHAPAPNSSQTARMMLTCRFPTSELASKFGSLSQKI